MRMRCRDSFPIVLLGLALGCQPSRNDVAPAGTGVKATIELGFDKSALDKLPSGWTVQSGSWAVIEDDTAPSPRQVLAQTGNGEKQPYNLALLDDVKCTDVDVSVRLSAVAGQIDQGGGLVWRAKDARNYYIARWNPLEKNVRLYEVVDGERVQLDSDDVRLEPGWHTLRVVAKGEEHAVYLDGRRRLAVKDATFVGAGKLGLWTKADARTHFDDLRVVDPK